MRVTGLSIAGGVVVAAWVVAAILAPVLAPYDPLLPAMDRRLQPPSVAHPFGTDNYGRDVLSRVVFGARLSLPIGLIAVGIAVMVGLPLGALAGYYRGSSEQVIMRTMDVILAFPSLLLAMAISTALGTGLISAMIAVGTVGVPEFARLVYGQVLSLREREFAEAARALGNPDRTVLFWHLLPNALAPIVVRATLGLGFAILTAASLSFLGLGVRPPLAEWGAMISEGREFIVSGQWWMVTFPGLAIASAVLGFNLLGDGLRDMLDPRLRF
ncbi:MAG: ABC transporter permease [Bacillota bacterium]|nr:ABC transporter permease [Bacillota bacterium]